ncbi:MAG: serine O-acetyltransferase [Planctomycetota bacterium]
MTTDPTANGTPHAADRFGVNEDLARRLVQSILDDPRTRHLGSTLIPDRTEIDQILDLLRELVFPGFFNRRGLLPEQLGVHVQELIARIAQHLESQVRTALRYCAGMEDGIAREWMERDAPVEARCAEESRRITREFMAFLPELRALVAMDVQAAYEGDLAASHIDETILCYPGIYAVFVHRVAHRLVELGVPLVPRIMQEMAHARTGIDIHPGATIGHSFFIDHGGGVVIGETSRIGQRVRIYQGVTLGAKSFKRDDNGDLIRDGSKRHPTIGDRVTIYAGAVVLGGDTEIGDDCVLAGGVFVTQSVPAGHVVRQRQPELLLRGQAGLVAEATDVEAGG